MGGGEIVLVYVCKSASVCVRQASKAFRVVVCICKFASFFAANKKTMQQTDARPPLASAWRSPGPWLRSSGALAPRETAIGPERQSTSVKPFRRWRDCNGMMCRAMQETHGNSQKTIPQIRQNETLEISLIHHAHHWQNNALGAVELCLERDQQSLQARPYGTQPVQAGTRIGEVAQCRTKARAGLRLHAGRD